MNTNQKELSVYQAFITGAADIEVNEKLITDPNLKAVLQRLAEYEKLK